MYLHTVILDSYKKNGFQKTFQTIMKIKDAQLVRTFSLSNFLFFFLPAISMLCFGIFFAKEGLWAMAAVGLVSPVMLWHVYSNFISAKTGMVVSEFMYSTKILVQEYEHDCLRKEITTRHVITPEDGKSVDDYWGDVRESVNKRIFNDLKVNIPRNTDESE